MNTADQIKTVDIVDLIHIARQANAEFRRAGDREAQAKLIWALRRIASKVSKMPYIHRLSLLVDQIIITLDALNES